MKISRIVLTVIITLAFLAFARRVAKVRPVDKTAIAGSIKIEHKTRAKQEGNEIPTIEARVAGAKETNLYYRIGTDGDFQKVQMTPKEGTTDIYIGAMPLQPKGVKGYYYIEAVGEGASLTIPDRNAPDFKPFLMKYEGKIPGLVILIHVLFTFGAVFFGIISLFTALDVNKVQEEISRAIKWPLATAISMFVGILPSGIAMNYYAFGVKWEAFPFGKDITDNKAQIAFLGWLIVLILFKGSLFSKSEAKNLLKVKSYLPAVAASLALTFIMWAIPHSL